MTDEQLIRLNNIIKSSSNLSIKGVQHIAKEEFDVNYRLKTNMNNNKEIRIQLQ